MIVVRVSSGLGNQLFQYALALHLRQRYHETVFLDISSFRYRTSERTFQLDLLSDLPLADDRRIPVRVRRRYRWFKELLFRLDPKAHRFTDAGPTFPEVLKPEHLYYFDGYWQTERFLTQTVAWTKAFQPKETPPTAIRQAMTRIRSGQALAVHVRRGDYFSPRYKSRYGLLDADWYRSALDTMLDGHPNRPVWCFTDDPAWVEQAGFLPPGSVIVGPDTAHPFWHIWLMSGCSDQIISNSTFGWWGAYLNDNPEKKVLAPAVWLSGSEHDPCPVGWIRR